MEALNISVITLLISHFLSMAIISTALKNYLETQWTATYHFSIMPLLILTPFLILLPVLVSIICFNHMQKTDIMERLQGKMNKKVNEKSVAYSDCRPYRKLGAIFIRRIWWE